MTPPRAVPAPRPDLLSRLQYRRLTKAVRLPEPVTRDLLVDKDIPVEMRDGTTLLTDYWAPAGGGSGPTVLVRTPYGRDTSTLTARVFAERGYDVVVQSCRGTFGSGGTFDPFFDEKNDGQDAVAWLTGRRWFVGPIHTFGPSYLGVTQWSLSDKPPDALGAMVIAVSARSVRDAVIYPGEGFALDTALTWNLALDIQERSLFTKAHRLASAKWRIARASLGLPDAAVRSILGHDVAFYRNWLEHNAPGDPWWAPVTFARDPAVGPPLVLVAGWSDLFLAGQVADYVALRAAGRQVRLVIGPWIHTSPAIGDASMVEALEQLASIEDAHAGDPVRFRVTGTGEWRTAADWPVPATTTTWHLHPGGRLAVTVPATEATVRYRYDPADSTPMAGGRSLNPFTAGRRRQRAREDRDDVLVWTGDQLRSDLTVIGHPRATIALTSTNPTVDLFVRLCDVDPQGRSTGVADGYLRLPDAGDPSEWRRIVIDLDPLAHCFRAGHRVRLQVSSGAHPLHIRNPGTRDPLHDFDSLTPSDQQLHLGPEGVGCELRLPVTD